jgi:anti-sigma-K factor RskA
MKLNGEALDYLAGVYVLGCTSARVRRRFAAMAARDPRARAAVDRWARRLAPLAGWVPPVRPQPETLKAILARVAEQGEAGRTPRAIRLRHGLVAAVLGLALALGWMLYSGGPAPALTAEIADAQGQAKWDFAAPADGRVLVVTVRQPGLIPADHSYEIWALSEQGAKPVSLGLVPAAREQVLALNPAQRKALLAARRIAITAEPVGGSPTGQATGPILHVASLIRRS